MTNEVGPSSNVFVEIHVRLEGGADLARQIYLQLRAAVRDGRLVDGERLPPTRELAQRLSVSRNTVTRAYEWLAADGLSSGRAGGGTFVHGVSTNRTKARRAVAPVRVRAVWRGITAPQPSPAARFDFGVGSPDASMFPFETWRRLVARELRASRMISRYGDAAGHPGLRAAIAHHAGIARGVEADAADVLITSGAQGAFDLIARALLEPGSAVGAEEPGYPPVRMLFESWGARVKAVPVDKEGMVVDAIPDDARLVYVTPSHQFPMGMPMSHARRIGLLAWARRRNAMIIEDDYDSEFRFSGRPLETLHALDVDGRVLYAGSFSKTLLPALRLGFVITPPSLRHTLESASHVSGWHVPWAEQAALAAMIEKGLFARHIRKMRREYASRHEAIFDRLLNDFAEWVDPIPSSAGMHICAPLRRPSEKFENEIHRCAVSAGIAFDRLSRYCAARPRRTGLALGYGSIDADDLPHALELLHRCFINSASVR